MDRRSFIGGAAGGFLVAAFAARGQNSSIPVIGFINSISPEGGAYLAAAFRQGLKETGFVDGQSVAIEYRWAEQHFDRLPAMVNEMVQRRVALIAVGGGGGARLAAKAATTTIPIVFNVGSDPVKVGLVASLARPGGNATGVNIFTSELAEKRFGLLNDAIPAAGSFAVLANPNFPPAMADAREVEAAGRRVGKDVAIFHAGSDPLSRAWHCRGRGRCSSLAIRFSTAGASRLWHWPRAMPSRRSTNGVNSPKPAAS